jgi:hypothetical protein
MKTNVILKSEDRELFGVIIRQETSTGFFNLSDLQECYLRARIKNGWVDKRIDHILSRIENTERIYYVLKEQNIINVRFDTFIEEVNNEGISKVLKKYGAYKTTGARHTKTTWVHDSIWVLVALELSPIFYAKTVIWLRDDLIKNRIEAGNFCKKLNGSIQIFNPDGNDYVSLAKALNYIVFNRHETGIRNNGTKDELRELVKIEEQMSFAIDMGYINTFSMLIEELRKLYKKKYGIIKPLEKAKK